MQLLTWLSAHWFDLFQTAGIVASILFTGVSIRTDIKARRLDSLFRITKHHREIWSEIYDRPELSRILDPKADLTAQPVTAEERLFVNFLILHLNNSYQAIRNGLYHRPQGLSDDINSFFSLPIPRAVWEQTKNMHDEPFVAFVTDEMY